VGFGQRQRHPKGAGGPERKDGLSHNDYLEARGNPSIGPLFANVDRAGKGNGRLTFQVVYVLVRNICKRAGISKPVSSHRIRHSVITETLELTGGNVRLVQKFSQTLRVYDNNRHKGQAQVKELLAAVV